MLVRAETEVLHGLTGILGPAEKQGVGTGGLLERELVKGQGLASGSENACASRSSEAESSDGNLGDLEEAVVVRDGTNDDDSLLLVAVLDVRRDAGEGHGRAVDAAHEQPAKDDLVEGGVGAARKKAIELDEHLEVDIVALWSLAVRVPHVVTVEIDTCNFPTESMVSLFDLVCSFGPAAR